MEEESKNLNEISKKLGIDDRKIISKASEYLRLLKVKSNTLNINEYAKIVICLDVAATNANNATFNPDTARTLLKYQKAKYRKEKNIVERILNVTQVPDVKYICLHLKVAKHKEFEENALTILKEYKNSKRGLTEFSHPQYDAMAVYQTSKMMKIKVNEGKLVDFSHLKPMQWTNLKNQWHRWMEENKIKLNTKQETKAIDTDKQESIDHEETNIKQTVKIEEYIETYEVWKRRMLDKAYTDLKFMEKNKCEHSN